MTNEQMRRRKSQPLNPPERDKKAKKEAKERKDQKGEKTKDRRKEKTHSPKGEKAKERKNEKAKKDPENEKAEKDDKKRGDDRADQKASSGDGGVLESLAHIYFAIIRSPYTWINHESVLDSRYVLGLYGLRSYRIISRAQAKQQKIDRERKLVTK